MATDAAEMALVHRMFRRAFGELPGLIDAVEPGDVGHARAVGDHLELLTLVLHHHHSAEDELIWPALYARAPASAGQIRQMEDDHAEIARLDAVVESARDQWMRSADRDSAGRLIEAVTVLSNAVAQHLDDEERTAVPVIQRYLTGDEWQAVLKRGAAFLTPRTVRRALVIGGLTLEATQSQAERQRFLAGIPAGPRMLVRLFAARELAAHRQRVVGVSA